MPTGTPYDSRIVEYPSIRVDAFHGPRRGMKESTVDLYLLTHTHMDHTAGLEARSFAQLVYCSTEAKQMLLKYERGADRISYDRGESPRKVLPYSHLRVRNGKSTVYRDLLRPIPLNTPQEFQLNGQDKVVVTAIDANHCPGSVMYLIEGSKGAVLHTGDMRAEYSFLEELRRNKFLNRYIVTDPKFDHRNLTSPGNMNEEAIFPTLEAIYLDTAALTVNIEGLSKADAVDGLISIMALYPEHTRFFLDLWTWGYEDVMKAIARSFGAKIHVDRYKKGVYSEIESDPLLDAITTTDPYATRFHACDKFNPCDCVPLTDRDVIRVDESGCAASVWEQWREVTCRKIHAGEIVTNLIVPLGRHSGLPELKRFVELFKPKRVVPNELQSSFQGADWALIPFLFDLSLEGSERVMEDMRANGFAAWTGQCHAGRQYSASLMATNVRGGSAVSRAPSPSPSAAFRLERMAEMLITFFGYAAAQCEDDVNAARIIDLIAPLLKRRADTHEDESPLTRGFLNQPSSEFLIRHTSPYTTPFLPGADQFAPGGDPKPDIGSSAISHSTPQLTSGPQPLQQPLHPESAPDLQGSGGGGAGKLVATEEMVPQSTNLESSSSSSLHMPAQSGRGDISSIREASPHPPRGEHSQSVGASTPVTPRNGTPHIATAPLCDQYKPSPATNSSISPPRRETSSPNKVQFILPPHDDKPRTVSGPERRVSHRRQRLSLLNLIERCDRARRSPRPPVPQPKREKEETGTSST